MHLCYVLLSPTWGMHQYTAGLANRQRDAGDTVSLVTTSHVPRDRYAPAVAIQAPVALSDRGFSPAGLRVWQVGRVADTLARLKPDLVHFTGPHLWNPFLLRALHRAKVPTVHTIHDLHPHAGSAYGRLLYLWNRWVSREADHLLVHGRCHRAELVARGVPEGGVTFAPLMHLFVSYTVESILVSRPPVVRYEPWVLFFARLEPYKGIDVLVAALRRCVREGDGTVRAVIAGQGRLSRKWSRDELVQVDVRNRLIGDQEGVDLFCRCGLVVLPYVEASQSALVAASYFFRKPVVVTRVGALPEYVVEGETGWVIPPNDPHALADAIQSALGDAARLAEMGAAGRRWYDRQRDVEERTVRDMYARLVAGHGST